MIDRLADVLVGYSLDVQPGEKVLIEGPARAEPLLLELVRRVLRAGGLPIPRLGFDGRAALATILREGSDEQAGFLDPADVLYAQQVDKAAFVLVDALEAEAMAGIEPARHAIRERAREPVTRTYMERTAGGELGWVLTEYPSPEGAALAGMSAAEWEAFVYGAGFLDADDPVARWRELKAELDARADFLERVRTLRFVAEGTDLTLGVAGRRWNRAAGERNFPDGEVYSAPVETEVDGVVSFSFPGIFNGQEVDGIRLRFEDGEVAEAEAATNEGVLRELLAVDAGARRLGEVAFGLNGAIQRFTHNLLFDEKIGGTFHLALGAGYPETGSLNESGLHWDIVCDLRRGGEVHADGELVYRDGHFLV